MLCGRFTGGKCPNMTYAPKPVDGLQLFIQLHHEDDEEDDGEDHLANGHRWISAVRRRCVTDEDDEAQKLHKDRRRRGLV